MIRVLHSVSNMARAGIETMLMNYYREIDRSQIQFDFLANKPRPGERGNMMMRYAPWEDGFSSVRVSTLYISPNTSGSWEICFVTTRK